MTTIKSVNNWADTRVSIELTNGIKFDVHVDRDTGKVKLLCDSPHSISENETLESTGFPASIVHAECFGYPSD